MDELYKEYQWTCVDRDLLLRRLDDDYYKYLEKATLDQNLVETLEIKRQYEQKKAELTQFYAEKLRLLRERIDDWEQRG